MRGDDLRPDIVRAQTPMFLKFGAGREIRELPEHLWDGEMVEPMATVQYGGPRACS